MRDTSEQRARLIVLIQYREYLHYASMAQVRRQDGESPYYMADLAIEHRIRARDAAFIASGSYPAPRLWRTSQMAC